MRVTVEGVSLSVAALTPDDIPQVHRLYTDALSALRDPAAVRPDAPDFFAWVFDRGGEILGMTLDGAFVGYGVLRPPLAETADHDGSERAVPAGAAMMVLDGSAVHPDHWRGGLQRAVIRLRVARAAELGAEHVIALAGPRNVPSMRNLTKSGFAIRGLAQKSYGWRYVHHRTVASEYPATGVGQWAPSEDVADAEARFAAGEVATLAKRDASDVPVLRFEAPA